MSSLDLKDTEIKALLAEVSASMQAAAKKDVQKLSKAVEESSPAGMDESPVAPEGAESAPAAAPEVPEAAASDDSAPPMEDGTADMGAESMGGDPAMDSDPAMDAQPMSLEQLTGEYGMLDDEQLKMHYMAVKTELYNRMNAAQSAPQAPEMPAESPTAPAMKAEEGTAPHGNVAPVTSLKSEAGTAPNGTAAAPTAYGKQNFNGPASAKDGPGADLNHKQVPKSQPELNNEVELSKSESVKDLEAQVAGLTRAVELLTQVPLRKAVTSLAQLERESPPAKEVDPESVKDQLSDLIRSGKLSKAQKDAVTDYFSSKNPIHLKKIAHLFK